MHVLALVALLSGVTLVFSHNSNHGEGAHGMEGAPGREPRPHEVAELLLLHIRRGCSSGHLDCGHHGTCVMDDNGHLGCRCHSDTKHVWGGKQCQRKGEFLPLPSEYLIGLSMGVVVILFLALVLVIADSYFQCRKRHRRHRRSRQNSLNPPTDPQDHHHPPSPQASAPAYPSSLDPRLPAVITADSPDLSFPQAPHDLPSYSEAVPTAPCPGSRPLASSDLPVTVLSVQNCTEESDSSPGRRLTMTRTRRRSDSQEDDSPCRGSLRGNGDCVVDSQSGDSRVCASNNDDGLETNNCLNRVSVRDSGSQRNNGCQTSGGNESRCETDRSKMTTRQNDSRVKSVLERSPEVTTVLSSENSSTEVTSGAVRYQNRQTWRQTTQSETENDSHLVTENDSGNLSEIFTLPRIPNHHDHLHHHEEDVTTRSMSSLACEDTLSELSDTYHNRGSVPQPCAQGEAACEGWSGAGGPAALGTGRTYRVLLMGSFGPQPVFLYEPWRNNETDHDHENESQSSPPPTPYGHCRDDNAFHSPHDTGPPTHSHLRAQHSHDSRQSINSSNNQRCCSSSSSSSTVIAATACHLPKEAALSNSGCGSHVDTLYCVPYSCQTDYCSDSELSVFFDHEEQTFVRQNTQ